MDFEPIETDAQGTASFLNYARLRREAKAERDADVGDVVHVFHGLMGHCLAAVVGGQRERLGEEPTVDLMILRSKDGGGLEWWEQPEVSHDENKAEGSWHWPCGGH